MLFIDIHTHHNRDSAEILALRQADLTWFKDRDLPSENQFYSLSLHPWQADLWPPPSPLWETAVQHQRVLALGETGLDKLRGPELSIQERAFSAQATWAKNLNKPLILHLVQQHHRLAQFIQAKDFPCLIVHGFERKWPLAQQLARWGASFSIGAGLFKYPQVTSLAQNLSLDQLWLETDDQTQYSIEEIYAQVAKIRGLSLWDLRDLIWQRFESIFLKKN